VTDEVVHAIVLRALRDLRPSTILAVAPGQLVSVERYRAESNCRVVSASSDFDRINVPDAERFDLGIVAGVIEHLDDRAARALIATLRDVHCSSLLLAVPAAHWPLEAYLALGLELRDVSATGEAWHLYWFDVDRYNPEREWNNPQHWANPENFKRYRW
jgi:hypothetical protein